MYSNAAAVQTYNPAAADGSAPRMHSIPPSANQPYYSLPPGQQMSLPPGAPVTTGIPAGSQMPGYGAGQPAAAMAQPQYHVGAQGGGGYQGHAGVPGAPTGYQAPTMPVTQMYMPASSAAAQQPPHPAQQPGPAAEYQPYNMHGNWLSVLSRFYF